MQADLEKGSDRREIGLQQFRKSWANPFGPNLEHWQKQAIGGKGQLT